MVINNLQNPLADRMRPQNFEEFFGQEEIVGKGKLLRKLIENDELSSLVFWGPPGVGKTTLAQIVAEQTKSFFVVLSAVESGKDDLRRVVKEAKERLLGDNSQRTILFIDEIHRWNKAQQDALLPLVEKGEIVLIGATTENPSFEIIGPLLSRSRVFILKKLADEDIIKIINQSLKDEERGLGKFKIEIKEEAIELLAGLSAGDARVALNGLELAFKAKVRYPPLTKRGQGGVAEVELKHRQTPLALRRATSSWKEEDIIVIEVSDIKEALQKTHLIFDKKGEEFYNLISALHKSMRGSDANASLYWLARMVEGGCEPLYIARRVLRFAAEDIGVADSRALLVANAAYDACHKLGYPECNVHLAEAVVYCAMAKKSNLLYTAYLQAAEDAKNTSHLGVPIHLRNAPTKFMKKIGYGKDYKYTPDFIGEDVKQDYLPEELKNRNYLKK
ncbi:MAG: AAA ATPase central domain protein [Candidatus Magasanikbacteria bacterium GW2011_GWC2_37_14]|uniref:Replication-associated recombination protein A n=1 Tax=Candidatus Magasanikbacteria bacterium GW2011_GWC2_37_14 TaxID=1619046 RepID=A0A0G0JJJ7_9BACT|nr:MAG: AAA ATPase central domain protein [Candidatus Magasanikbacteria bacterium GW2011_GWC2_37_14]